MSQDQSQPPTNESASNLPESEEELSEDVWGEDDEEKAEILTPAPPTVISPAREPSIPPTESTRSPQELWQQVQPVLKTQTIRTLRSTIRVLEGVVTKLEAPPKAASPVPPASQQSPTPSEAAPVVGTQEPVTRRVAIALVDYWERSRPQRAKLRGWWQQLLGWVRSRLPESANQKLSDTALSGAIVGSAFILFWLTSAILSPKPTPVAIVPSPTPSPVQVIPTPSISPVPIAAPTPTPIPPEVKAPEVEQPVKSVPSPAPSPMSKPSPTPTLVLTPEQRLIAAIQDQVAEVTEQYANGLIRSVQANFKSSQLTVKVGDGWYELPRSQQDKLASEMLRRSKDLDFSKLELTDTDGTLLARSPVVGSEMIILQRTQLAVDS
jgi:hypothetical protein